MSRGVQEQAFDIEWRRMRDMDTYYPPRDDRLAEMEHGRRRQYVTKWCIEAKQVDAALDDRQVAMATHIRDLYRRTADKARTNFEFTAGGRLNVQEERRLRRLSEKHELAGLEQVAGQIENGRKCFHAICEGETFAGVQKRCDLNWRGAIDIIQTVLRALEIYHGFNEIDAARNNAA